MLEYKRTNGKNNDFIENCRRLDADLDQRVGKEIQRSKYEKYNQLDRINEALVVMKIMCWLARAPSESLCMAKDI